jgi:S-adenosylmethionine:tRNA ribosyltransferase-isomerase
VRLLVSDVRRDHITHARFFDLPSYLEAGDLLVVNTSATVNAALIVRDEHDTSFELHVSTRVPGGFWTVELRDPATTASLPNRTARAGLRLNLPADATATLLAPYPFGGDLTASSRLWLAGLELPEHWLPYLNRHGFPIRYSYVTEPWGIEMYQTIFSNEPGSAEMPSAGRPFSRLLLERLAGRDIQIAPILLHTGVASLEDHEPPYEEFYRVTADTAARINYTRSAGRRVVAVGTTVVRALETVTDPSGTTHPGEGWTNLVIARDHPVRAVTSLITGLHEPKATHLAMLERVATAAAAISAHLCGPCQLARAYEEARRHGYLWHEFGDSHLILG